MSSPTFTEVVSKLATLPEDAQNQVLVFIESLEQHAALSGSLSADKTNEHATDLYPLRGEIYRYDDPFEPAVPPEAWHAIGGQQ